MSAKALPNTFEDGMSELEKLVRTLEEGGMPLESAIEAFERGSALKKFCEEKLLKAKLRVDQITADSNGQPVVQSFDPDKA
jgi:exodeoxyribonuclease VII small subunit